MGTYFEQANNNLNEMKWSSPQKLPLAFLLRFLLLFLCCAAVLSSLLLSNPDPFESLPQRHSCKHSTDNHSNREPMPRSSCPGSVCWGRCCVQLYATSHLVALLSTIAVCLAPAVCLVFCVLDNLRGRQEGRQQDTHLCFFSTGNKDAATSSYHPPPHPPLLGAARQCLHMQAKKACMLGNAGCLLLCVCLVGGRPLWCPPLLPCALIRPRLLFPVAVDDTCPFDECPHLPHTT